MPNFEGTTRAQSTFLRAFHKSPAGPSPADWPTPGILRKWLRRKPFRTALAAVQNTLNFQADFHLATAAAQAAQRLIPQASSKDAPAPPLDPTDVRAVAHLIRLAHARRRLPTRARFASPATFRLRDDIRETQAFILTGKELLREHPDDKEAREDLKKDQAELRHLKEIADPGKDL